MILMTANYLKARGGERPRLAGTTSMIEGVSVSSGTSIDPRLTKEGSVTYAGKRDDQNLPYLHCGPMYGGEGGAASANIDKRELILLHGKKFSKDDWGASGIIDGLCLLGSSTGGAAGGLSVTALDLPVASDGSDLSEAFKGLWSEGIISGEAVFIVSPSASGVSVLGLADLAVSTGGGSGLLGTGQEDEPQKQLKRVLRGWIPVAAGSVLKSEDVVLGAFRTTGIPILAIHGNNDSGGRQSTQKLVEAASAKAVELEGGHACYLDSPDEFVKAVLGFIDDTVAAEDSGRI